MVVMRHLDVVVILALLPAVVAAAQTAPRTDKEKGKTPGRVPLSFAQKLVDEWTTAARTHVAGTIDEPVKTIARWPPERFTLVLRLVHPTPNAARTLMFGLSLHTDIAIATALLRPWTGRTRSSWSTAR